MFISGCSTLDLFYLTYFLFLYNLVWWFIWYPTRWCSTEPCKICSEAEIWKLMVEGTQRDSLMGREDRGDWNHQTSIELALGSYRVVFIFLDLIFFKKRELRMYFETSLMSLDPCSCTLTESFVQATFPYPNLHHSPGFSVSFSRAGKTWEVCPQEYEQPINKWQAFQLVFINFFLRSLFSLALFHGWALVNFPLLQGGRLFEPGAYSGWALIEVGRLIKLVRYVTKTSGG